ncbi:MAG TPA: chromosome segregation protein SMC, partial [Chitinophagaceae bacterium]|nr:chromosome segregation protein SMC [Chitinophagaceae bacterium]
LLQRDQFESEKKVAVADTTIQNLERIIAQLEEEKTIRKEQLAALENERQTKEDALNQKKGDLQQLQQQNQFTREQILETQALLEKLKNQLADENRVLDARKNEHDLLKSLIDNMEGYPESVKFLHNNTGWNHNAPLLSDIIYVKEEYRTAVENVLEPYLNYYVVNDLQEGLQAIHLLDENKKGKANFFLLDKLNDIELLRSPVLKDTIDALTVVEFDDKYRGLANYLLNNVFIAENEMALQNSDGAIVLEKNGKYVKGNYSLSGGSVGLFEGKKIGRVKNLEKLTEEISVQDKKVLALKAFINTHSNEVITFNEQLKENAISEIQMAISDLTNTVFSIQNKIENIHVAELTGGERISQLLGQLKENQDAIVTTRELLNDLNASFSELTLKIITAEEDYVDTEKQYTDANHGYNESNIVLTRQQSKVTALKQEFTFKTNQLNELTVQVENSKIQLAESATGITETTESLSVLETSVINLLKNKEAEERKLNEADQQYYNLRNVLNERESSLRNKQKSREQADMLLNEIKDKLNELKLQLAGMKERLSVEFKVDLDVILDEERRTEYTLEELQEKNDRMKKRLENMGEINPTAIEAFTEMKKRYEFILEQKNDLVTAKESLLQTIEEVETTANKQFLDTFNKVRENFQNVFKALFTEDDT